VTWEQMRIQSSTRLSSVRQNEHVLYFTYARAEFYVAHTSVTCVSCNYVSPWRWPICGWTCSRM